MIRRTVDPNVEGAPFSAVAWCVSALLASALIGLMHDPNYATARSLAPIEEGRDIGEAAVMEEGIEAAGLGRKLGLVALLGAIGLSAVTMPRGTFVPPDGLMILIGTLLSWAMASILWSVDPTTTLRELSRLGVYAVGAVIFSLRFPPRTLVLVLGGALAGSVGAAVLFEIATGGFRPWRGNYRLTGSMHSNVLAVQAAIVTLIAYAQGMRRNKLTIVWWTLFFAAFAVTFLTKARTAFLTTMVGLVAFHIVGRPARDWVLLFATCGTLLAVGLLGAETLGLTNGGRMKDVQSMGRTDDTSALTGRIPLWNFIWHQAAGRRIQGHGWGAFWRIDRTKDAYNALQWYPRHSHNAYIHVAVDLGAIGLAMAIAIGAWSLARAAHLIASTHGYEYRALAAIIMAIFVNAMAESAFAMPRDMGLFSATVATCLAVAPSLHGATAADGAIRGVTRHIPPFGPRRRETLA